MSLKITGDVHAGRKFINDVPLHRRGEREKEVLTQLKDELDVPESTEFHVQVGDLFDSFDTDRETIRDVAVIYLLAAQVHDKTIFVVYPGNHDKSKDTTKVSAFDLFAKIVEGQRNIWVIEEPTVFFSSGLSGNFYGVIPYDPFKPAKQLAEELTKVHSNDLYQSTRPGKLTAVFTHCDTKSFDDRQFNLLPIQELSKVTNQVYNGHVHTPSLMKVGDLIIENVGSMQPYGFGEDPEHKRYLTVTPDELATRPLEFWKDKYIRIRLSPDAVPPEAPDCMGFKVVYEQEKMEVEENGMEVQFESFNTRTLFASCMDELKVSDGVKKEVLWRFDEGNF